MNKTWNKTYKILGIINLIFGLIIIYKIFEFTQSQISHMEKLSEQSGFPKYDISLIDLLLYNSNRFPFIIGILFITSGILIVLKKKIGWNLSYISWIITALILIPITIYGIRDVTVTVIGSEYWIQIYSGIGLILSLTFIVFLSLKPIRIMNNINKQSWLLSIGIIFLIYLTRMI
tara:strand:+ start:90 stop:614 length:525 start_codon:yes stop_codon:yes gene_type:complete